MKKFFLTLLLVFTFIGCFKSNSDARTAEDELYSTAREVLKNAMNDPDSYEKVSFEPDYSKSSEMKYYKLTYRGKNGFGGLVMGEVYVLATNDENLAFIGLEEVK
jgi:hypothetical protein